MKKINKDQICIIKAFLNVEYPYYVWKNERRFLGIQTRKEGFYYIFTLHGPEYTPDSEVLKNNNLYIFGKSVYYKPHLEFKMSNGSEVVKFFESKDLLMNFISENDLNDVRFIEV